MKQMAVQHTAFQVCVESFLEATNKRFDDVVKETERDAAELKASLQFTQNEVDNINKSDVLDDVVKRIEIVAPAQHDIEHGIDYLLNQTRCNNLRIDGVAEGNADTWADTEGNAETWADTEAAMRRSFISALNISENQARDIRIERAHIMTGSIHSSKPRPIMVKFENFKDREIILHAARKQKPRGLCFNEDLSQRELASRKEQLPKLREARENGKIVYFSYDRLAVRDRLDNRT